MEVLLFGGTSEGRRLAEWLDGAGIPTTVCVATAYGAALVPSGANLRIAAGRLDGAGMEALMRTRPFTCTVDATHPYAVEVTENIRAAARRVGLSCHRLVRDGAAEGDWTHAANMADAARLLGGIGGNVLLTTGSKEVAVFAAPGLRERCFPRVLPSMDSLRHCLELGFPPAHVLCMQGPFSKELNVALLRQYEIKALVTKASGGAGGFWDKVSAAAETGCARIVVDRPSCEAGMDFAGMIRFLKGEPG